MFFKVKSLIYVEGIAYAIITASGTFKFKSSPDLLTVSDFMVLRTWKSNLHNTYSLPNNSNNSLIKPFKKTFINMVFNAEFGLVDYLYLKGIGFKVLSSINVLFFKLNYSHYIYYVLPLEMKVLTKKKQRLLKFSFFQSRVSKNTISYLQRLRSANVYTQKGIFKKLQLISKKEGKKKQV